MPDPTDGNYRVTVRVDASPPIVVTQPNLTSVTVKRFSDTTTVLSVGQQGPAGPQGANANYTLPAATNATLGGVKVGANLTVDANGVLAAVGGMTQIANVTYGVSQIPNILGNNNARYVAGLKANTTTTTFGNNTVVKESYSGLAYNPTTNVSVGHIAGFTDTYSDPNALLKKQQFEVRASTLSYFALDQANAIAFSSGFSVQSSGGAKLYFQNFLDDISTEMQVDDAGVTIFTNGIVTVNGDEVVTLEVARSLFAPLTFKGG